MSSTENAATWADETRPGSRARQLRQLDMLVEWVKRLSENRAELIRENARLAADLARTRSGNDQMREEVKRHRRLSLTGFLSTALETDAPPAGLPEDGDERILALLAG